jgi:hypothetical protein
LYISALSVRAFRNPIIAFASSFTCDIYISAVNNVGRSHEMPTNFVDTTQKEIDDIHMHAPLRMTSIILPGMIKRHAFSLPDLIGSQRVFDIFA